MALYKCVKFPSLQFRVGGEIKRFRNGEYNTKNKVEEKLLDSMQNVVKVVTTKAPTKATNKQ